MNKKGDYREEITMNGYIAAKNYLLQMQRLQLQIKHKKREIVNIMLTLESCTPSYEPREGSGSRNVHRGEAMIAKMMDYKTELEEMVIKLIDLKKEISDRIDKLIEEDKEAGEVIYKKYFEFKGWSKIATETSYSLSHVYRLHRRGLEKIGDRLEDDAK